MNSKALRRLASDHGSLLKNGLPPNYLFTPSSNNLRATHPDSDQDDDDEDDGPGLPDDLTKLDVLLAGPHGTPFSSAVFKLHLDMPTNYPTAPPTASFRTPIFHPNVDPATGSICVDTLKRDWTSTLTLRDVLVTITCLLVQPNPASALNGEAGKLVQEDWSAFEKRARMMAGIHAGVPKVWSQKVEDARSRGEEKPASSQQHALTTVSSTNATVLSEHSKTSARTLRAGLSAKIDATPDVDSSEEENAGSSRLGHPSRQRPSKAEVLPADGGSPWIPDPPSMPLGTASDNAFGIRVPSDFAKTSAPTSNTTSMVGALENVVSMDTEMKMDLDANEPSSRESSTSQRRGCGATVALAQAPAHLPSPSSPLALATPTRPFQAPHTPTTARRRQARNGGIQKYATFPPMHRSRTPKRANPFNPAPKSPLATKMKASALFQHITPANQKPSEHNPSQAQSLYPHEAATPTAPSQRDATAAIGSRQIHEPAAQLFDFNTLGRQPKSRPPPPGDYVFWAVRNSSSSTSIPTKSSKTAAPPLPHSYSAPVVATGSPSLHSATGNDGLSASERRRREDIVRFARAGKSVSQWNRGVWGPRTGLGRL